MTRTEPFPRRHARTGRFTFGAPRDLRVSADGTRIAFLRSGSGTDPANRLWCLEVGSEDELLIADPGELLAEDEAAGLTPEERDRRERAREGAGGIVAYQTLPTLERAAFALAGQLFVADLVAGRVTRPEAAHGVFDPRLAPEPSEGDRVAYVAGRTLRLTDPSGDRLLASDDSSTVTWGTAEFIAAEEMGRGRGFWWSPDGRTVAACRVDVSPVGTWYLADPVSPWVEPRAIRYPAAGTANADVGLFLLGVDGSQIEVDWRRGRFEYLCDVVWDGGGLLVVAQTRDQREIAVLAVDPSDGSTEEAYAVRGEPWVEIVPGVPRLHDGRMVTVEDRGDTRKLVVDGRDHSPDGFQVRRVIEVGDEGIWILGTDEPAELHVACVGWDGALQRITTEPGVHSAAVGGGTVVLSSVGPDHDGTRTVVLRNGETVREIASLAESPGLVPSPAFHHLGERAIRTAVLLPADHEPGTRLPVLLDPYGGPHALRVQRGRPPFLISQWFADQGFAVVVADGRGTPGRGPRWEHAVAGDLAAPVLEDQITALHDVAALYPELDLDRVAIRGWSFGGYLAALAVLRRPDVFHAAIAGAPVTDWRLYDTHYTERYLGHPDEQPEAYRRTDLLADAPQLTRPLLLIHGLADDNVVAAHTLGLSRALLEAGRPHQVLPLSGVTHMTPQEVVAENLLVLQLEFLRDALGLARPAAEAAPRPRT